MTEYKSDIYEVKLNKIGSSLKKVKISSSEDASEYVRQFYFEDIEIFESFFLLLLNRANNTIGYAKISQGGLVGTVIDVRIIANYAINSFSSGVILVHNHPSGNTNPSTADLSITKKIKEALKLFDIAVLDHIIVTAENYYSFADNGVL